MAGERTVKIRIESFATTRIEEGVIISDVASKVFAVETVDGVEAKKEIENIHGFAFRHVAGQPSELTLQIYNADVIAEPAVTTAVKEKAQPFRQVHQRPPELKKITPGLADWIAQADDRHVAALFNEANIDEDDRPCVPSGDEKGFQTRTAASAHAWMFAMNVVHPIEADRIQRAFEARSVPAVSA